MTDIIGDRVILRQKTSRKYTIKFFRMTLRFQKIKFENQIYLNLAN